MLLLLLSCADGSLQDSVSAPDFPAQSVHWRSAELRCEGPISVVRAWSSGPGSLATFSASGTLEDGSAAQSTASLSLDSQDPVSGVQSWSLRASLEGLDCTRVDTWQLRLSDARGQEISCIDHDLEPC